MGGRGRAILAIAGVVETSLFIVSVLGYVTRAQYIIYVLIYMLHPRFIGACARKQLFVTIFATFLYIHFFLNLGVAAYLLFTISRAANTDIVKACEEGIRDQQTKEQCTNLIGFVKSVFWGVSIAVLLVEACASPISI